MINKFKTEKYSKYIKHHEVCGREIEYVTVYRFMDLDKKMLAEQMNGLKNIEHPTHAIDINPVFVLAYNEIIKAHIKRCKCTEHEAYENYSRRHWRTLATMINERLKPYQILFYRDGASVGVNDWKDAAEAGIILMDSWALFRFLNKFE